MRQFKKPKPFVLTFSEISSVGTVFLLSIGLKIKACIRDHFVFMTLVHHVIIVLQGQIILIHLSALRGLLVS